MSRFWGWVPGIVMVISIIGLIITPQAPGNRRSCCWGLMAPRRSASGTG